jgi:hypothetical protein
MKKARAARVRALPDHRQSGNGGMQKDMSEDAFGVTRAASNPFFESHLTMRGKILGGGWGEG